MYANETIAILTMSPLSVRNKKVASPMHPATLRTGVALGIVSSLWRQRSRGRESCATSGFPANPVIRDELSGPPAQ
jgi:hypothetical protein